MGRIRGAIIYPLIFLIGGLAYCAMEMGFRGRTHWSMLLAGGLCVTALYVIAAKSRAPVWKKWLAAGAVITTVEFITGIFVNILLDMRVWDYSGLSFNLFGQICPVFSLAWMILSIPVIWVFGKINSVFTDKGRRKV